MAERIFTRAQNNLRGFFGLGPSQATLSDVIVPTLDVGHLLRARGELVATAGAASAGIAPGTLGSGFVQPPGPGVWLLRHASIESAGPATSGSFRLWLTIAYQYTIPANALMGINENADLLPRAGVGVWTFGKLFDPPVVLTTPPTGVSDIVQGFGMNDAASVGNLTVTTRALWQQVEAAVGQ